MNSKKKRIIFAIMCVLAIVGSMFVMAFAEADDAGKAITSTMDYFISYVVDMFRIVGILIGVYAIAQFALAFKDDNPDQKQRGTIMLVIAVMLVMVKSLARKILQYASVTGLTLDEGFLS